MGKSQVQATSKVKQAGPSPDLQRTEPKKQVRAPGQSIARASRHMTASGGTAGRARMAAGLQRTLGNARVGQMLAGGGKTGGLPSSTMAADGPELQRAGAGEGRRASPGLLQSIDRSRP